MVFFSVKKVFSEQSLIFSTSFKQRVDKLDGASSLRALISVAGISVYMS